MNESGDPSPSASQQRRPAGGSLSLGLRDLKRGMCNNGEMLWYLGLGLGCLESSKWGRSSGFRGVLQEVS